ncbi:hypothetical protein M885DRAFT_236723 [Pelagophyceae sp. CCMP2097]|nr:hypothetical protein M885DRAFT_236723 [Pelagophyceae sp. CCMP2097]
MEMSGKARPKAPTAATKRMLAEFPPSEADLDLRQLLKEFSDVELWEGACALAEETAALRHAPQESIADWCRRVLRNSGGPEAPPGAGASGGAREYPGGPAQEPYATGGRSLNLAGWAQVHVRPLRALSLALGASLTALDLSGTAVDDRALETLCARLFALRALRLGGCDRLSNLACQAVAAATHATLTQLDISGCGRLSHEACGWLAGELGSGAPRCARLQSLNVARCAKMNDQALRYAAAGLRRLAFVSVAQNEHVGDVGVCTLAKHCRRLEVLDVSGCPRVGDRSLKALGRHCHGLRVLIAPRCGSDTLGPTLQRTVVEFTDAGARALARGCSRLASLNVAGARRLSEAAFGELATACRALGTLDCTGCDEVTVNGLRSLVEGVGFVREATSFFGFVPLPADVARDALRRQQGDLEHRSARTIQNAFSKHRAHVAAVRVGWLVRRTRNAELIQRFAIRWLRERRHAEKRYQIRRVSATLSVQRVVARGVRARRRSTLLADTRSSLRAQFDHIVAFQALWRGYRARARDEQCVAHAVRRLRGARLRRAAAGARAAADPRAAQRRRRVGRRAVPA